MVEVVRDAPRAPLAPIDTNVKLPQSVLDAGARAEALFKAAYPQDAPPAAPPADPPVEPAAAPSDEPAPAPPSEPPAPAPASPMPPPSPPILTQEPPVSSEPPAEPPVEPQDDENVAPDQWKHRYQSMRGRVEQQRHIIGGMQDQMAQMGDELMRLQQMVEQPRPVKTPQNLLTPEDEQNYGTELIDLAKRAAQDAIAPKLEGLEKENGELRQQLVADNRRKMLADLDREVPNWRQINRAPGFKRWLSLRDIYSGGVRHQLLSDAYQAADAPRVVSFFQGFLRDAAIASGHAPAPQPANQPQPANPAPQPRQPAIALETLAAPGRPRPASGSDTVSSTQQTPSFTRAQVKSFYDSVRRGYFTGREADKATLEAQIFAAQSAGRIT